MDKLIKKIIAMPDLSLSKEEFAYLKQILSTLDEINSDNFVVELGNRIQAQKELSLEKKEDLTELDKIKIELENIPAIIIYLNAWCKMTKALVAWNDYLANTWFETTSKVIGTEDLLPLVIELLPNDSAKLEKMLIKIDQASLIDTMGMSGFVIANLYAAIRAKLRHLNESKGKPDNNADNIHLVAEIIRRPERIQQLKLAATEYENDLKLKIIANVNCQYYYKNGVIVRDKEKIAEALFQDLESGNFSMLFNSDLLALLIEKYIAILDIKQSLQVEGKDTNHKIIEFSEKFLHHKEALEKNTDGYLSSYRVYTLFSAQTEEQKFLELAGLVVQAAWQPAAAEVPDQNTINKIA